MDRELRRKIINMINASAGVLNVRDEDIPYKLYSMLMNELQLAHDALRDEMNSGIHDAYINN